MPRRHPPRRQTSNDRQGQQMLRIIGGEWRSRRLPFPAIEGLRPTPDRVRETLFNWLQPYVAGARCLDLFSGSGALGLEALSRGAELVTFVDQAPEAVRQLRDNLRGLRCSDAEVVQASVLGWLEQRQHDLEARYDLVFMDPPFRKDLVAPCCRLLESRNMLAANAVIYIENEGELGPPAVPANWQEHRHKQAGQVSYRLYLRTDSD